MKLASVRLGDRDAIGIAIGADDERIIEIGALIELGGVPAVNFAAGPPRSMRQLIQSGPAVFAAIKDVLENADAAELDRRAVHPDAWYPPVRAPGKVLCVAMNNSASNARKISAPEHPAFFLKPPSCLIGHLDPIRVRPYYGSVHPEPELAIIIGKTTRDVAAIDALDAVFGYSIFNDITSNGMRAEDRFHYWAVYAKEANPDETEKREQHLSYAGRYKGSDTFGALGPWLVIRDAISDPDALAVQCKIHGEVIAEDNTRYYNYKVAEVISFISFFHTLHPGDVISMGTAFKPQPGRKSIHHANFQTTPGPIEVSIAGLGRQRNPIVIEETTLGAWRLD